MRKGLVLLIFITASFFIYPFLVFGEFDDELFPEDQPEAGGGDNAVVEKSLSDLDLKYLVDGCSSSDDESFKEIDKRCGLGQIDSCRAAASLFERFCNEGIVSSCEKLVDVFERGLLVDGKIVFKKDPRKAVMVAKKACDLDVGLCLTFGSRYLFGFASGYRTDPFAGQFLLDKACSSGSPEACNFLGRAYSSGDVLKKDPVLAFKYYFAACKISPESTLWCNMGFSYEDGDGVPRNYGYAFKFYDFLCSSGNSMYCNSCGLFYEKGTGVKKSLEMARILFDKGCLLGGADSCTNLARFYYLGIGVKKDLYMSVLFRKKGCDFGSPDSCLVMAVFYEKGEGVPKSIEIRDSLLFKAAKLYRGYCNSGVKYACDKYAELYDMGFGIED